MKQNLLIFAFLLFAARTAAQEPTRAREVRSGGIQIIDGQTREPSVSTRIVFWTSTTVQGAIKVYFNGSYAGKITKAYGSAPRCGTSGCVTVTVTRSNNTWYGVAADGTRWESVNSHLEKGCNAIRLYSTGRKNSGGSGGSGSSGSTGDSGNSGGYQGSDLQHTAQEFGRTIGTGIGYALSQGKGWDSNRNRLDAGIGYGIDYGGLGVKINYQAPVVFGVTAGFGRNMGYEGHPGDDKKFHWNAGIQLWCTDHWNFELGIGPRYFKKFDQTQTGFSVMTHYQHQVWRRIGLIGGIGGSLSTSTPDGFKKGEVACRFEWNIGIVVRLVR